MLEVTHFAVCLNVDTARQCRQNIPSSTEVLIYGVTPQNLMYVT